MAMPLSFTKHRDFYRKSFKYLFPNVIISKDIHVQNRYKTCKKCDVHLKGNSLWSLRLEFGKMAKFADGAVVAQVGDTSVLVAVSCKTEYNPSATFLPLIVDYRQKSAAAGRIPTNHLRRELGPTDKEILTSRVIDRSLRSLFPGDFFYETQITCNLLSVDGINDPDVISINAASAALSESDIPWNGPIGAVRVSGHSNDFIVNPTRKQQENSDINLVIAADKQENVVMLEGEMNEVPYGIFRSAIKFGAYNASKIAQQIDNITGKQSSKRFYTPVSSVPEEMINSVHSIGSADITAILNNTEHDKVSRDKALQNVRHKIVKELAVKYSTENFSTLVLHEAVSIVIKQIFRDLIVHKKIRCDGRSLLQNRKISCSVDLFKPVHGSALFQRGQTQVLSTVTFDSLQAAMKVDPISVLTGAMKEKNFMLHYEFPAYATNEVKPPGIKNRRELGHGALAEKGLRAIIPDDFPFSIRLTAEVLESNGSSSMASICCGSLALMDAGVPIKRPAAGIAIGLITNKTDDMSDKVLEHKTDNNSSSPYHLLADIMGIEDYMGDMDMKVGGTKDGITAIQMDLKIPGIPVYVIDEAILLAKAKLGTIIKIMSEAIDKPRENMKASGPVVEKMIVTPAKRGQFVGIGGMNLKKLTSHTGVTVSSLDESTYEIFAPNKDAMEEAKEMIDAWLTTKREPNLEFGAVYEGKITEIREQGLLVQLHPAMEPVLLPNSQIDHRKISHPEVLGFKVGQMVNVKYFGRDPTTGRIRLSRKVLSALPGRTIKFLKDEDA